MLTSCFEANWSIWVGYNQEKPVCLSAQSRWVANTKPVQTFHILAALSRYANTRRSGKIIIIVYCRETVLDVEVPLSEGLSFAGGEKQKLEQSSAAENTWCNNCFGHLCTVAKAARWTRSSLSTFSSMRNRKNKNKLTHTLTTLRNVFEKTFQTHN